MGADAENADAVKAVYRLKRRPKGAPLTVAVSDLDMLMTYAKAEQFERVIKEFLPGPVTFILPKTGRVLPEVNPKAIGVRIPDSLISRELSRGLGRAITATSANVSSHPPPYTCKEAIDGIRAADVALNAGLLPRRRPSTVIDLTRDEPNLVREGPLGFEEFLKVHGKLLG